MRSKTQRIDWGKCLFCQEVKDDQLHSVMTFSTSEKILENAKYNHKQNVALADVNDLIAAEGKYHLKCQSKFFRDTQNVKGTAEESDLAMGWLCSQLKESARKGHILELHEVGSIMRVCVKNQMRPYPVHSSAAKLHLKKRFEVL